LSLFDVLVRSTLPVTPRPLIHFFAKRYVAGDTLEDAVATVQRLAREGCCATLDVLGESVENREQAQGAVANYLAVIDAITTHSLDANVSLKPTQMGLLLDEGMCRDNIAAILDKAHPRGIFVRIDMEDAPTTDATLRVYRDLVARYPKGTGIVLQARLRRTLADAVQAGADGTNVRLCKGIYLEPRSIAYCERDIIRNNYVHILRALLSGKSYVGVATHDEWLVAEALAVAQQLGVARDRFEFQMLLGVDPELRRIITGGGHKLRVYVPFGSHWYPYSVRRLRENPTIARAGLEAFVRRRMDT
jgi:proline dehydrogenase